MRTRRDVELFVDEQLTNPTAIEKFVYLEASMYRACLPKKFWKIRRDDLKQSPCSDSPFLSYGHRIAGAFKNQKGALLLGDVSVGKTMLLCWILKQALSSDYSAYYTTMSSFSSNTLAFGGMGSGYRHEEFQRALDSDFVAFDDLGRDVSGSQERVARDFSQCLRRRIDDGKPTLFASSLMPEHLGRLYGSTFRLAVKRSVVMLRASRA